MLLVQREMVQLVHKVVGSGKILSASHLLVQPLWEQLKGYKGRCFSSHPLIPLSPVPVTWHLGLSSGCCGVGTSLAEQRLLELLVMRCVICSL